MGMCKSCNEVYSSTIMVDGICPDCLNPEFKEIKRQEIEEFKEIKRQEIEEFNSIILTTEMAIDIPIEKRIELISSECVFGINIVKDFFSGIRDIVGGNVKSLEKSLKDAKEQITSDMKKQAYSLGGNAVIAVKIEHTFTGNILSVFGIGTVVKFK